MVSNERNLSLDLIRIIAVLAVVMIHTSAGFVAYYDVATSEFLWGNIFDSISQIGVPLFVMVSGALFLNENYNFNIKKMFFINIKNIALLLIFWSVLYSCIYEIVLPLLMGRQISLKGIIFSSIMDHYHMWYLYMIIGLYLITPFIRYFVKKENKKLVLLFITLSIITQFSKPILQGASLFFEDIWYLVDFIDKFYLDFFSGYITYYILGWYLTNIKIRNKWIFYCFGIVSLLIIIIYTLITKVCLSSKNVSKRAPKMLAPSAQLNFLV